MTHPFMIKPAVFLYFNCFEIKGKNETSSTILASCNRPKSAWFTDGPLAHRYRTKSFAPIVSIYQSNISLSIPKRTFSAVLLDLIGHYFNGSRDSSVYRQCTLRRFWFHSNHPAMGVTCCMWLHPYYSV